MPRHECYCQECQQDSDNLEPKRIGKYDTFDMSSHLLVKKNGKTGRSLVEVCGPWYTKVLKCELCGRLGSPKYVCYRNDIFHWNFGLRHETPDRIIHRLCISCWNKIKPINRKRDIVLENRKVINKTFREIAKCAKLQRQAS